MDFISEENMNNVKIAFFAVAIVLLLVMVFKRVKVTCDCRAASKKGSCPPGIYSGGLSRGVSGTDMGTYDEDTGRLLAPLSSSPQRDVRPPAVVDDKLNADWTVYGWPKNTAPPFEMDRRPIAPTWSAALSTSPRSSSPQDSVRPPAVADDKLNTDWTVYGWPKNTEPVFDMSRKPIIPTWSAAKSSSAAPDGGLKKKASSISLAPCTWEGEEACIKRGLPDGIFPQYPFIPFNNPYPYYNPAASEDNLNPWPNPPREGVVPERFSKDTWKPDRWKPDSTAWVYKDMVGTFPSVINVSRERYYEPPFSRRQPPYYLQDYIQFPDKQSFYKDFPNPMDREPVTNPVWPFTVEPKTPTAGLANVRRRKRRGGEKPPKCEDEPLYHDFVGEHKSYL